MLVSLPVVPKDKMAQVLESHGDAQLTMPYRQVKQEGCENGGQIHKVISHPLRVQRRPSTQVSRGTDLRF